MRGRTPLRATPAADRTLAKALDAARSHGIKYVVVSYLQPAERGTTAAAYEKFADQLNRAGETARAAGLTLGYHNHGFEFAPLRRRPAAHRRAPLAAGSGAGETGARRVLGVDHRRRSGGAPHHAQGPHRALHLKDKAKGAPRETDERKVAKATFTEVGHGALDFPAILKAAQAAGVEHYFVEQDQTPGDPIASLRQSYEYLHKLADVTAYRDRSA